MDWKFSEEQEAYQDALRGWLAGAAPMERVRAWQAEGEHEQFAGDFAASGWAGVGISEESGGQGGGLVELALTAEALAGCAAPSSGWLASVLTWPLVAAVPEAVEALGQGGVAALAVPSERLPDGGGSTTVTVDGDRLTGSVARVLAGSQAGWLVVPVRLADGGLQLRLVDVASEAGVVRREERRLLDRSRAVADVHLDGASSRELDVDAAAALRAVTARAGVLVGADALGASERMLRLAVEYAGQRRQFGVPIGSFQAVKHTAAQMLVGVEAARSVVYFAAASVDAEAPQHLLHAAATKAQVTAEAERAADQALTLHGAIGYTWEHDLHLFYKRAKLDAALFGAPRRWNDLIADGLALT